MFKLEKISTIVAVATSLIAADLAGSSHIVNAENFRSQNYQPQYSQTTGVQNQNWAQGLFEAKDYNFGTDARAAKAEHVFSFKNEGDQPIEIMSVSVSCTCTKPEILTKVVAPGEEGRIAAKFQTKKFVGQRGATLNVSMKKGDSYATALLSVRGYIRQDVVLHPESVEMPKVIASEGGTNSVKVLYAGRSDWKITEAKCENKDINVQVVELLRQNGRVEYELQTDIAKDSPVGQLLDVITVYTNDLNLKSFPVSINANIVQPIRVADTIEVNVFEGDTTLEKILMASSSEFQIVDFSCDGCPIEMKLDGTRKKVHQVEFSTTGMTEGKTEHILKLITNHPQQPVANIKLILNVQTGK